MTIVASYSSSTSASASASYTKLKSGAWGIRSTSPLSEGQSVSVAKRDGTRKTERVAKVVWSGGGVWIAAIGSSSSSPSTRRTSRRGTWTGCSCGSVEEYSRDSDCFSCRHDAE